MGIIYLYSCMQATLEEKIKDKDYLVKRSTFSSVQYFLKVQLYTQCLIKI